MSNNNHNNSTSSYINEHSELLKTTSFSTKSIHFAQEPEKWDSRCVVAPIVLATTFKQFAPHEFIYDYGRCDNPTRRTLELAIAELENAKYGACFSSGIGAVTSAIHLIENGDHAILSDAIYGGTHNYLNKVAPKDGVQVTEVDMANIDNVVNALKPNTKVLILLIQDTSKSTGKK